MIFKYIFFGLVVSLILYSDQMFFAYGQTKCVDNLYADDTLRCEPDEIVIKGKRLDPSQVSDTPIITSIFQEPWKFASLSTGMLMEDEPFLFLNQDAYRDNVRDAVQSYIGEGRHSFCVSAHDPRSVLRELGLRACAYEENRTLRGIVASLDGAKISLGHGKGCPHPFGHRVALKCNEEEQWYEVHSDTVGPEILDCFFSLEITEDE